MVKRALAAVVAALVALGAPEVAQADANSEARVFFERGNEHLQRAAGLRGSRRTREIEQAVAEYFSSLRIVRTKNCVFNAAVALEMLGRLDEAYGYFAEYVGMPGITDDERTEGTRRRDALRPRVAVALITSEPPGAEVRVDRPDLAPRGATPLELALPAGEHRLFFSLRGYAAAETQVTTRTGDSTEVNARLNALPVRIRIAAPTGGTLRLDDREIAANEFVEVMPGAHVVTFRRTGAAPVERRFDVQPGAADQTIELSDPGRIERGTGQLVVESSVAGNVTVDGQPLGQGRRVQGWLPEGPHIVRVVAPGYMPYTGRVEIEPDEVRTMRVQLAASVEGETNLGKLPMLVLGSGIILGGIGALMSIRAFSAGDEYDQASREYQMGLGGHTRQDLQTMHDDVDSANLTADIIWAAASAVAITGVILLIVNDDVEQPESTGTTVAVGASPDGARVVAHIPWGL